jgi:hypothetical protein
MAHPSSEVNGLLLASPGNLPLIRTALRPAVNACKIRSQNVSTLFPDARDGESALAGLLLRIGCWAESHAVAQNIQSSEGSYWHAIVHRMEPDSSNAGYWFRRVGQHAIFPELFRCAVTILKSGSPKHWHLKTTWDPFLFIEWCDEARERGGQAETAAVEIQMAEWQLLFNWCAYRNSLQNS